MCPVRKGEDEMKRRDLKMGRSTSLWRSKQRSKPYILRWYGGTCQPWPTEVVV